MPIEDFVEAIRRTPDCLLLPPAGKPPISQGHVLPADLDRFYELCGGVTLFAHGDYHFTVVPPQGLVLANPVIVGDVYEDDISSSWYIVGDAGSGEYVTIDLSEQRLGRCYDSFFDRHAVAGSCPIIAASFEDLLQRMLANKGQHWYWLRPDFAPLGDAYE